MLGIATNDTAVTIFVHSGVEDASTRRLKHAARLEADLITLMREAVPDAYGQEPQPLHLAETCQALRERGHAAVRPNLVEGLLRSMAQDGRDQDGGRGNLHLRKLSRNTLFLRLQRSWSVLEETARLRREAAEALLGLLLGKLPKGVRGKDLQIETTVGEMQARLNGDALLRSSVQDISRLMDRALLWLHEQQVVTLGRGLTVFRPAMTLHLNPKGGQFTVQHFTPLEEHYVEQTIQTHVMAAYAEKGLTAMEQALRLTAHRAKGLEFNHVAILNGGWERPSKGEDDEAPRRLFYVAMTRAKQSLTVMVDGAHPFVGPETPGILSRRVPPHVSELPKLRRCYVMPDPKLVDLSYAGRLHGSHSSLTAISVARVGDPVTLAREGERWLVRDAGGRTLGPAPSRRPRG